MIQKDVTSSCRSSQQLRHRHQLLLHWLCLILYLFSTATWVAGGVVKTPLPPVEGGKKGLSVGILYLDTQATASFWQGTRTSDTPAVVSLHANRIRQALNSADDAGRDLAILDAAAIARDVVYATNASNYRHKTKSRRAEDEFQTPCSFKLRLLESRFHSLG